MLQSGGEHTHSISVSVKQTHIYTGVNIKHLVIFLSEVLHVHI